MEIYILRHGIAEDAPPGGSDAQRALTPEGKQKLRKVLDRAAAANVSPSLILTSPLVRAVQTAEIASDALGYKQKPAKTNALLPSSSPREVWDDLRGHRDETAILLAGHEPMLSQTVVYLLGASGLQVDFKKGALVRIDMDNFKGEPRGVLKWMLVPKVV